MCNSLVIFESVNCRGNKCIENCKTHINTYCYWVLLNSNVQYHFIQFSKFRVHFGFYESEKKVAHRDDIFFYSKAVHNNRNHCSFFMLHNMRTRIKQKNAGKTVSARVHGNKTFEKYCSNFINMLELWFHFAHNWIIHLKLSRRPINHTWNMILNYFTHSSQRSLIYETKNKCEKYTGKLAHTSIKIELELANNCMETKGWFSKHYNNNRKKINSNNNPVESFCWIKLQMTSFNNA